MELIDNLALGFATASTFANIGFCLIGVLLGTLIGVLVIPGLYYVFATMIKGRKLINEEVDEPVSEQFIRRDEEATKYRETVRMLTARMKELLKRKKDE